MPRSVRALTLAFSFVGSVAAQGFLSCDPNQAQLRPGKVSCITVQASTGAAGVVVQAGSDPALLSVTPASATTGAGGSARFLVQAAGLALNGTTLTFSAAAAGLTSCAATLVCDLPALQLRGEAGSYPGNFALELHADDPVNPGSLGLILVSPTPGPLPLFLTGQNDPRALAVGLAGLTILPGQLGPFLPPFTTFAGASLQVPVLSARGVVFAQGLTIDTSSSLPFHRISQPQPIYLAPARSVWDRGVSLQMSRSFMPVIVDDNGLVLVPGGGQGGIFAQIATRQVEVYDPVTDSWSQNPISMNLERSIHTATRLTNGKWLVCGGVDMQNNPTATAELYDPATRAFTPVGDMAIGRMGHTATLLQDGRVLVAGGLNNVTANPSTAIQSALASTEYFSLDQSDCDGSFAPGPSMTRGRAGHAVVALADGRHYVLGGVGPGSFLGIPIPEIWEETEFFDGTSFRAGPSMPNKRAIFPVTQVGSNPDRYLCSGGLNNILGLGTPTAAADVYTAAPGGNGSWARAGSMSRPTGMLSAFRVGFEVVHFGGLQGDLVTPNALDTTEVYDVRTGTWSNGPRLSTPRGAYGAYRDAHGIVHLLGGAGGPGQNPPVVATTEQYFR